MALANSHPLPVTEQLAIPTTDEHGQVMSIWDRMHKLRETCESFLDLPAPVGDEELDERVIQQQLMGASILMRDALDLIQLHFVELYAPEEGVN